MTLTIEIPALDRLCAILESQDKSGLVKQIEDEIVARLKEAAEGGAPRPVFTEVAPAEDHPWKAEAKAAPETEPEGPREPRGQEAPKAQAVTLDQVQRAAAQLWDAGKLSAVTGMFEEFGIKKLSDLKGDALQAFAERLRGLGAAL